VMWDVWSIVQSVGLVVRTRQPGLPNHLPCLGLLLVLRHHDSYLSLPTYALDLP
jgi:hypothetical protein